MHKRTNFLVRFLAMPGLCAIAFAAPSVALACTPPLGINHASAPPKNEQVVTSIVDDTTLAFVPYAQGEKFIEYRVWAMDHACRAVEVPVEETLGNGQQLMKHGDCNQPEIASLHSHGQKTVFFSVTKTL